MVKVPSTQSELKSFWTVVSVILYCLKMFGLTPFSIQIKKSGKNSIRKCTRAFVFSKMGLAYNALLSVALPVTVGLQFPRLLSMDYIRESSVIRVTDPSHGFLCVSAVWIIIITWTFNQGKAVCIMNKILEIDVKLSDVNKQPSNKMTSVFITVHVIINTCLWAFISIMEFVHPLVPNTFVKCVFFTVPSFVIYWFVIEYFMVVRLVARKLEIVNKNLSSFKELRSYSSHPSFLNDYLTSWSLLTHSQLDSLNSLHNIRTALHDLSQDITEFFSFPILGCITYSLFSFLSDFYVLITPIIVENKELSFAGASRSVAWILVTLYPLALLFFNVAKAMKEAQRTGRLVHKLLSSAVREEMKTKLHLFSLQLLHENMKFTAYGFFTLDFTLLHSMLGATATFLVILVQFQQ